MVLDLCNSNLSFIFEIIRYLIKILKFIVPTVLIVMATIDVAKIVMNPDDKVKKDTMSIVIKRIIYAVLFYLIPTLVSLIFRLLVSKNNPDDYGGGKTYTDSWMSCISEILG